MRHALLFSVFIIASCGLAYELIAGVTTDPVFGPMILFGHGGTAVEVVRDPDRVGGDRVRGAAHRGLCGDAGELHQPLHELSLLGHERLGQRDLERLVVERLGVAEDAGDAGVRVLDVVDGVLVVLLAELLTVDGERGVGGEAGEGVPDGVGPDPVDEVAELDDVAGALREAGPVEVHELPDERGDVFHLIIDHLGEFVGL